MFKTFGNKKFKPRNMRGKIVCDGMIWSQMYVWLSV